MKSDAKEAAKYLFESDFTVDQYEKLQQVRKDRLKLWQRNKIQVLVDNESELIMFGNEVLTILKELYANQTTNPQKGQG